MIRLCSFLGNVRLRFLDNRLVNFNEVHSFGKGVKVFHFLLCNLLRHFLLLDPESGTWVNAISVSLSRIRVDAWACINVFGMSDNKHFNMNVIVLFSTARPIGGLSCSF